MALRTALAMLGLVCAAWAEPSRTGEDALQASLRPVADRTFRCGLDQTLHIDREARTLTWLGSGELKDFELPEVRAEVTARTAREVAPGTIRFTLPPGAPDRTLTLRVLSPGDTAKPGMSGLGAELFVNEDRVGDGCAVERGRSSFLQGRFDTIRANLCGNDPAPGCIAELRRRCGTELGPACLSAAKPALERISKAHFDRVNAGTRR